MSNDNRLDVAEVNALYSSLFPQERDELLWCLLVAASIDGETVTEHSEECLLELAERELIEEVNLDQA